MSILNQRSYYCYSCEGYTQDKSNFFVVGTPPTNITDNSGRGGRRALHWTGVGWAVGRNLDTGVFTTFIDSWIGIWLKLGSAGIYPSGTLPLITGGVHTSPPYGQLTLAADDNGRLQLWENFDSASPTLLAQTATGAIPTAGAYYPVQLQTIREDSDGYVLGMHVYVDNLEVLSVSGIATPTPEASAWFFGPWAAHGTPANVDISITEMWKRPTFGGSPLPPYDDWTVRRLTPIADATYSEWNGALPHYQQIDDHDESDGDATTIVPASFGGQPQRDTFIFSALPVEGTVVPIARLFGHYPPRYGGQIKAFIRIGPASFDEAGLQTVNRLDPLFPPDPPYYYADCNLTNQSGGLDVWTPADFASFEAGVERYNELLPLSQLALDVLVLEPAAIARRSSVQLIG